MCGIYGWIGSITSFTVSDNNRVSKKLHHRGPDDAGFIQGETFGLGFRRLSIIDLSENGHQPMSINQNKEHIIFNGEIYNYLEIKKELEAPISKQ
ncbi:MAG: hypothetical protein IPN76_10330 [Saprospiraceae bacterium]|nr:hypothetical protein [Saprospiraceae bacterium]